MSERYYRAEAVHVFAWTAFIRAVARTKGYALGEHGSRKRDLDLIAVPWSDNASTADELIDAIVATGHFVIKGDRWEEKPHGRRGTVFILPATFPAPASAPWYVDLSVMPIVPGGEA